MKYQNLLIIFFILYVISFFLPAYAIGVKWFQYGGADVWYGWKCAATALGLVFTKNPLFGILISLPNFIMLVLPFVFKRMSILIILLFLLICFTSCSVWWIKGILNNNLSNLHPGYWFWILSITGSHASIIYGRIKKKSVRNKIPE